MDAHVRPLIPLHDAIDRVEAAGCAFVDAVSTTNVVEITRAFLDLEQAVATIARVRAAHDACLGRAVRPSLLVLDGVSCDDRLRHGR